MTPGAPFALITLGLSVLLWPSPGLGRRLQTPVAGRRGPGGGRRRAGSGGRRGDRLVLVLGPVLAVLLIAPQAWWLLLGAAAVVAGRRRSAGRSGPQRSRRQADLAVHHELVAACLDAGMPVGAALRAVADALPPTGARGGPTRPDHPGTAPPGDDAVPVLAAVAAMLELGATPDAAWKPADDHPDLRPLAAAARRSALGGAGLADAVREQARVLRQQVETADRQATGRAGVLMVAPLGLCFLPAFLCLGLAPVVLGLIGQLDLF